MFQLYAMPITYNARDNQSVAHLILHLVSTGLYLYSGSRSPILKVEYTYPYVFLSGYAGVL